MKLNDLFKAAVIVMYGENCILCRSLATTVHHLFPKGMGGCGLNQRYNPLNGVPVCERCHTRIHDSIGVVAGREEVYKKIPELREITFKTHPLTSHDERGIKKELQEIIGIK
jgi:hypothetical protein